jgi:hypothetical protein
VRTEKPSSTSALNFQKVSNVIVKLSLTISVCIKEIKTAHIFIHDESLHLWHTFLRKIIDMKYILYRAYRSRVEANDDAKQINGTPLNSFLPLIEINDVLCFRNLSSFWVRSSLHNIMPITSEPHRHTVRQINAALPWNWIILRHSPWSTCLLQTISHFLSSEDKSWRKI